MIACYWRLSWQNCTLSQITDSKSTIEQRIVHSCEYLIKMQEVKFDNLFFHCSPCISVSLYSQPGKWRLYGDRNVLARDTLAPQRLLWGQSGKCTKLISVGSSHPAFLGWSSCFDRSCTITTNYHNGNNNMQSTVWRREQKTHTLFIWACWAWVFAYWQIDRFILEHPSHSNMQQVLDHGRAIRPHRKAMGVWSYRINYSWHSLY